MKIKGIALDMDGLLFDTEGLYFRVGEILLERRGHRFTHELQQRMMGRVGLDAIAQMIQMHALADAPEDLLAESDDLYADLLTGGVEPMPGLDGWMQHLVESRLPFGVATSSRRRFTDRLLPTMPWADQLAFVLTGDDVNQGKPNPEIYLRAASKLMIEPEHLLVLEDSGNGTASAVAAGAITVSVPNANTANHDFSGATLIADNLSDPRLLQLINRPDSIR
ncbi:MAG: HAD-IA family hydrolase [Planctomycetota bacterium]